MSKWLQCYTTWYIFTLLGFSMYTITCSYARLSIKIGLSLEKIMITYYNVNSWIPGSGTRSKCWATVRSIAFEMK